MNRLILIIFVFVSLTSISNSQFSPKYKLNLLFESPGYEKGKKELLYKWNRTVDFREEFHFFLDQAPLKEGYSVGVIAGVVYPKNGALYCTLSLSAVKDLKAETSDNAYQIGEARFFKIPKSMTFELPLSKESGFQKCTVTITPIKG
jgi:hypothetical protein